MPAFKDVVPVSCLAQLALFVTDHNLVQAMAVQAVLCFVLQISSFQVIRCSLLYAVMYSRAAVGQGARRTPYILVETMIRVDYAYRHQEGSASVGASLILTTF